MLIVINYFQNKSTKKQILNENQNAPGIKLKKLTGGNQPPKNKIEFNALINNILEYSPKENNANPIAEYSTLYPETNSASASGKSKGCRFVSASVVTKKIRKIGNSGKTSQTLF